MTTGRSGWIAASRLSTPSPSRPGMRRSTSAESNGSRLGEAHALLAARRPRARGSLRGRALRRAARARPGRRRRRGATGACSRDAAPRAGRTTRNVLPRPSVALDLDPALVLAHDLGADEEAEPGAVPGLLRREERLEDLLAIGGRRRRGPVSRHGDLHLSRAGHVRASSPRSRPPRGVASIALVRRFRMTCWS